LETLLLQNLDALEAGITPVHRTLLTPTSSLSFLLARDREGRATLIEYDVIAEIHLLIHALEHLHWLLHHLPLLAQLNSDGLLVPTLKPRLLFVAPLYPSGFERGLTFLTLTPELYTYTYLRVGDQSGLLLTPYTPTQPTVCDFNAASLKEAMLTDEETAFFKKIQGQP
jgi:hypothetical protein